MNLCRNGGTSTSSAACSSPSSENFQNLCLQTVRLEKYLYFPFFYSYVTKKQMYFYLKDLKQTFREESSNVAHWIILDAVPQHVHLQQF